MTTLMTAKQLQQPMLSLHTFNYVYKMVATDITNTKYREICSFLTKLTTSVYKHSRSFTIYTVFYETKVKILVLPIENSFSDYNS